LKLQLHLREHRFHFFCVFRMGERAQVTVNNKPLQAPSRANTAPSRRWSPAMPFACSLDMVPQVVQGSPRIADDATGALCSAALIYRLENWTSRRA
jgi:hypothetical protein